MGFIEAAVIITVVAIVVYGVVEIVKYGTRYSENAERMKRGYPLKDGTKPIGYDEKQNNDDELSRVLKSQQSPR